MAEGGFEIPDDNVFTENEAESGLLDLRHELLRTKVDDFYTSLNKTPDVKDYNNFEFGKDGRHLFVNTDTGKVQVTHRNDPTKFLKIGTITPKVGGVDGVRRHLSISDFSTTKLPKKTVAKIMEIQQAIPDVDDAIELQDLSRTAESVTSKSSELETSLTEVLGTMDNPPLPMREIMALNQRLQSIKGELLNNLSKLTELDSEITQAKTVLSEMDDNNVDSEIKDRQHQKIKDLMVERRARLEVINENKSMLSTQIARVKNTIEVILYENTTLGERIRTLFREQGITLFTLITALGFCISTLVMAITGGGASVGGSGGGGDTKGWVKKQLIKLKDLLVSLGDRALTALPGIIGSVISWLFKTAGDAVGYLAEHLYMLLLLFVAGVLEIKKK